MLRNKISLQPQLSRGKIDYQPSLTSHESPPLISLFSTIWPALPPTIRLKFFPEAQHRCPAAADVLWILRPSISSTACGSSLPKKWLPTIPHTSINRVRRHFFTLDSITWQEKKGCYIRCREVFLPCTTCAVRHEKPLMIWGVSRVSSSSFCYQLPEDFCVLYSAQSIHLIGFEFG